MFCRTYIVNFPESVLKNAGADQREVVTCFEMIVAKTEIPNPMYN